jgi:aminoglycoside/choline kinase family phosphotransferase
MTDREAAITAFLRGAGWSAAASQALAGDASPRRYRRLHGPGGTAILMDAPSATCGPVTPFLRVSAHLAGLGLSAPRVLAADAAAGLILLEDLGDDDFLCVIDRGDVPEQTLYLAALDAVAALQAAPPPPDLTTWTAAHMAALTRPAFEEGPGGTQAFDHWAGPIADTLADVCAAPPVFCHRDFHAGNLFWLPDRPGPARVGIIDHQDAFAGPAAYDLVSLLTDARRDLAPGLPDVLVRRWLDLTGGDASALAQDMAVLAVQRNLRVHGVLTRLARTGRPHYAAFLPRVRAHLLRALDTVPALARLAPQVLP